MIVILRAAALLLTVIVFLAYGWGDRDYLSLLAKLFWLSPAFGLLIIGIAPLRILRSYKFRILPTLVFLAGMMQVANGIIGDFQMPIEPDTNAATLRAIIFITLALGIFVAWRPAFPVDDKK
jgi:hypothetical protein